MMEILFKRSGLFLLIFYSLHVNAQSLTENYFKQYSTADGLSHNTVSGILQDSTGYTWLSTFYGMNRFNGKEFIQYHSSNDSLSIAAENLSGVTWLRKNILGVYSSGLHIINTRTNTSSNLFIPYYRKQYQYKFNMIVRAMGDEEGNIYVLSRSGFYHFDKNLKLVTRFDYYSEAEVPVAHFFYGRELLQLDKNRLMIVSVAGLYMYDKTKNVFKKMTAKDELILSEFVDYPFNDYYVFLQAKPGELFIFKTPTDSVAYVSIKEKKKVYSRLPFNPIRTAIHYRSRIMQENDSVYYITGQVGGFYKMDFFRNNGHVKIDSIKYFENYQCYAFLKDKNKKLWIGTNKGFFRQNDQKAQIEIAALPASIENAFPSVQFKSVLICGDTVYAGTRGAANIVMYRKKDFRYLGNIDIKAQWKSIERSMAVLSIVPADNKNLLAATDGPLFLIDREKNKARPIYPKDWSKGDWSPELFSDSRGITWISASLVYLYNHKQRNFSFIPREVQLTSQIQWPEVMKEDNAGNIWMAGHGLSRYNVAEKRFDVRVDSFPFIKMPDKQVNAMVIDKKRNTIWFNSENNGLLSYDIIKKTFSHFTTKQGLTDNNIAALIIIEDHLWIAGYSGLNCLNLESLAITGFGKEDGFPNLPVMNRSIFYYDSLYRQLYLPISKVLVRFNPRQLLKEKPAPKVFIESLSFNQSENIFLPSNELSTSWKENEVTITIGTINFLDASNQRYAYRVLKNDASTWIDLGEQPTFSISSLSTGLQKIQLKVYSATNRWPEQVKEISIDVIPPLWKKTWFRILLAIFLAVVIYIFIKWRIAIARKKEMVNTHIEKLKADDYKNQFELEQISNYFSSSLAGKKNIDEVLWDVAANLIGRMNYEDCIIYWWNKDKTRMIQKAAYGPKGKPEVISESLFEVKAGQGIVGHVMETLQPELVNDTRLDSRYRVDDQFRLSEICVPIIHDDELLGVIDSEHPQANYFNERDIKILTTIATLIGNKIKHLESEQILEIKQKELAGINEQLAEARLTALQAQMNPHFVFNALNSIKRMILDEDNAKASRYLSKFALMIRLTMEHSKDFFITLEENINYLGAYLEMEKLRFEDSFRYKIIVEEGVDISDIVFPSMIIQPIVENAIWHGLLPSKENKNITINFCQRKNKIICSIEDNGIGIQQSQLLNREQRPLHRSAGLQNLRKRLKILNDKYNMDCSMEIIDLQHDEANAHGTRVIISFIALST